MAELTPNERLQPSLLDRLTDNSPKAEIESRDERVLSFRKLRESVIRDLEWLLNAGRLETTEDLSNYPEVRHSVLNYGIRDLAGTTASGMDTYQLEQMLRRAILDFEPRILPHNLRIQVSQNENDMNLNSITLEIEGEIWGHPMPEHLYLKTVLDLELGIFQFPET
ncbi:MAG: type VI secretion system baseplate subunit TssE [Gemmatimonadales bacterium]|nr:MAG: type VI secretion system baseplate subunit TssE [Gemmatimonadales bacterium]